MFNRMLCNILIRVGSAANINTENEFFFIPMRLPFMHFKRSHTSIKYLFTRLCKEKQNALDVQALEGESVELEIFMRFEIERCRNF